MGRPKRKKKIDPEKKTSVNPELEGFDIRINPFGEIQSNFDIEEINEFLNRKLKDKKLKNKASSGKESGKDDPGKMTNDK
jgi:hypothetical protein